MSETYLDQCAWRGDGPPYTRFGRFAMYRVDDIDAWLDARFSVPVNSTSEAVLR